MPPAAPTRMRAPRGGGTVESWDGDVDALRPVADLFARHPLLVTFLVTVVDATGFPFPGRVVLVLAGAYAATGRVSVVGLIAAAAAGAALGDHLWYAAGRWGGKRPLHLYCRLTLGSRRCVQRADEFYRRFGGATIVIGRFFAGVKIFTAPLAGSGVIPYHRYLFFEVLGAVAWASAFILIGWALGARGAQLLEDHGWILAVVMGALVIAALLPVGIRLWRRARHGPAALA
jgi:membrane-associated protein